MTRLNITLIVREPTATSTGIAYGLDKKKNSRGAGESYIIAYNLGRGTLDDFNKRIIDLVKQYGKKSDTDACKDDHALGKLAFEESDLFRETVKPVDQLLKDSGMKKEDMDDVALVGASHFNLGRPPQPPPR
ncbi:ATPase with role in protein import into the ER, partial [Tulasnella sp. 408]